MMIHVSRVFTLIFCTQLIYVGSAYAADEGWGPQIDPFGAADMATGNLIVKAVAVQQDESGAKIKFALKPGYTIKDAVFYAPGLGKFGKEAYDTNRDFGPGDTEILHDFWSPKFEPLKARRGINEISLSYTVTGTNRMEVAETKFSRTRSSRAHLDYATMDADLFGGQEQFQHILSEMSESFYYGLTVVEGSKLVWVGQSDVELRISTNYNILSNNLAGTQWFEHHAYNHGDNSERALDSIMDVGSDKVVGAVHKYYATDKNSTFLQKNIGTDYLNGRAWTTLLILTKDGLTPAGPGISYEDEGTTPIKSVVPMYGHD